MGQMPVNGWAGVAGGLGNHLLFTPGGGGDPSAENVEVEERFGEIRRTPKSVGRRKTSHSQA